MFIVHNITFTSWRQVRRLLVAGSRLGDIGDETRFGVACLLAMALEGGVAKEEGGVDVPVVRAGLKDTLVRGATEDKAGEASKEGELRELDKFKVGDADESLVAPMEKGGEVVSASL